MKKRSLPKKHATPLISPESSPPFTREEAMDIMEAVDKLFVRLGKKYGDARMDNYTCAVIGLLHPDGVLTNVRGNLNVAQFASATALNILVDNVCNSLKLPRDEVLLSCVTELAEEVRKLWTQTPLPPSFHNNGSVQSL